MKSYRLKTIMIIAIFCFNICTVISPRITTIFEENNIQPQVVKNWTVMLYFCADTRSAYVSSDLNNSANGLYVDMWGALNFIDDYLLPGSESDINIIALFDYPWFPNQPNGHANLYEITAGNMHLLDELGPTNMGDQQTLEDFITYCKTNYPATYYSLSLIDHGRGYAGFCYDYHAPHPYWAYALGDCLTVEEIDSVLGTTGGVDLLCLNACSGGSFEVAWQLVEEVDYLLAGEVEQGLNVLYHPVELAYNLSHNVNYTPLEFAMSAFDCAENIQIAPWGYTGAWLSVSLYDLKKFDSIGASPNLMSIFNDFADVLMDELVFNKSIARAEFIQIRAESIHEHDILSSKSMMVDLYDFIERVRNNTENFYYQDSLDGLANQLLTKLDPASNDILLGEHHRNLYDRVWGFNICIPDSHDLYQEFLYPNFYENLAISVDTKWDEFIFFLFPELYFNFQKYEFWEFQLNLIDPSVSLHVFIEQDPLVNPDPLHIGLNEFSKLGNGIDVDLEGAEFYDDLLFGNTMIRIPSESLGILQLKAPLDPVNFKVVVNATAAASATQQVNLTVKHVNNHSVLWSANKISDFNIGETLICEVSTDDEITDFVIIESPFNQSRTILGMPIEWFIVTVSGGSLIIVLILTFTIIFSRKKKMKNNKKKRRK